MTSQERDKTWHLEQDMNSQERDFHKIKTGLMISSVHLYISHDIYSWQTDTDCLCMSMAVTSIQRKPEGK